jgi:hypothetical protein
MTKYWFKPHDYGYGATPVSWEGWALVGGLLAVVGVMTIALVLSGRNDLAVVVPCLAIVFGLVAALCFVARRKTDGPWRWRWGPEQN